MAMTTPVLNQVPTFDATKSFLFSFAVPAGGEEVQGNTLYVIDPKGGEPLEFPIGTSVSSSTAPYRRYNNPLPANSLENGRYYSAYITTSYLNPNYKSTPSNTITFYCFAEPTFGFLNLQTEGDNVVSSSNFTTYIEYSQQGHTDDPANPLASYIVDPLASYAVSLYDQDKNLINTSGSIYTRDRGVRVVPEHTTTLTIPKGRIKGDVNGNGEVDMSDESWHEGGRGDNNYVSAHIADLIHLGGEALWCADVNDDGYIDTTDWLNIERRALGTFDAYTNLDYYGNWTWRDATHDWRTFVEANLPKNATIDLPSGYSYAVQSGGVYIFAPNPPINDLSVTATIPTSVETYYTDSYNFGGLENGKTYYVRATGITANNAAVATPLVEFRVSYDVPEGQEVTFTVTNDCKNGCVRYSLSTAQEELVGQYTAVRIKRKRVGEYGWLTLQEKKINSIQDFQVQGVDYLTASGETYVYAWVPLINDAEGSYRTQEVYSVFDSVFVCDDTHAYKFDTGVSYGTSNQVQDIGKFSPLNRQHPVYVANAITNYQMGSFNGRILEYAENGELSRVGMVAKKNIVLDFLTNKKPKILKDFNGNIWLLFVIDTPTINYEAKWGNGLMTLGFSYAEFGDAHDVASLQTLIGG